MRPHEFAMIAAMAGCGPDLGDGTPLFQGTTLECAQNLVDTIGDPEAPDVELNQQIALSRGEMSASLDSHFGGEEQLCVSQKYNHVNAANGDELRYKDIFELGESRLAWQGSFAEALGANGFFGYEPGDFIGTIHGGDHEDDTSWYFGVEVCPNEWAEPVNLMTITHDCRSVIASDGEAIQVITLPEVPEEE